MCNVLNVTDNAVSADGIPGVTLNDTMDFLDIPSCLGGVCMSARKCIRSRTFATPLAHPLQLAGVVVS